MIIITFILTGGINCENALHYLDAGASHVVVTSYVFRDGEVRYLLILFIIFMQNGN